MDFKREELEQAELIVVVDWQGNFKWSSHRADPEVAVMLESIAKKIRNRALKDAGNYERSSS